MGCRIARFRSLRRGSGGGHGARASKLLRATLHPTLGLHGLDHPLPSIRPRHSTALRIRTSRSSSRPAGTGGHGGSRMHKYRHLCILLLYSRCYDYFCCRLRRKRLCRRRGAAAPRRPPRRHHRRHHGAQQRRFQTRGIAAPSPRSGQPHPRRHHRGEPGRTRRRVPGPAARRLRGDRGAAAGRHGGDRRRRRPPAGGRGRLGEVLRLRRTPAPGPTACPSFPASARRSAAPSGSPSPAATRRRPCWPSPRASATTCCRRTTSSSFPPPARPGPARPPRST